MKFIKHRIIGDHELSLWKVRGIYEIQIKSKSIGPYSTIKLTTKNIDEAKKLYEEILPPAVKSFDYFMSKIAYALMTIYSCKPKPRISYHGYNSNCLEIEIETPFCEHAEDESIFIFISWCENRPPVIKTSPSDSAIFQIVCDLFPHVFPLLRILKDYHANLQSQSG